MRLVSLPLGFQRVLFFARANSRVQGSDPIIGRSFGTFAIIGRSFGTFARQMCTALHLSFSLALFCLLFLSFFFLLRLLGGYSGLSFTCRLPALCCRAAEPLRAYTTSTASSQRHETRPLSPNHSIYQRPRNRPPFLRTGDMSV